MPKYTDPTLDIDLAPVRSRSHADEQLLDLWQCFDTLWARRLLIAGVTLGAAVVAALYALTLPRQYRAEATVFLMPPTYATTLRPDVMSVEAYAKLAESDYILSLVEAELQKSRPDLFPAHKGDRYAIYTAKLSASREPQKPYLPLVGLSAQSDSPEKAKIGANTWADVFIREQGAFAEAGKTNSANFILSEFPKVEKALSETEHALETMEKRHAQELAALKSEIGLSLKQAQLAAYEYMAVSQEEQLVAARRERDQLKPSVAELEKELATTPQYLTVSKAITDDALWNAQTQTQGGGRAAAPNPNAKLQTQEVNPVYISLNQRLARERVDYNATGSQIASLQKQLEETRRLAAAARAAMLDGERRIADVQRRQSMEAASLKRTVDTSRKSFEKLSDKIGEARLAQSEPDKDLKLGAYAELPAKPSGPRRKLIVAGAAGGAFTLTVGTLLFLLLTASRRRGAPKPPYRNITPASV